MEPKDQYTLERIDEELHAIRYMLERILEVLDPKPLPHERPFE